MPCSLGSSLRQSAETRAKSRDSSYIMALPVPILQSETVRRLAPVKRLTLERFPGRDPTLLSSIFHNPKEKERRGIFITRAQRILL